MLSANQGDYYFDKVITKDEKDNSIAASCVQDSKTGDIILKMVNYGDTSKPMQMNLGKFGKVASLAEQVVITGNTDAENSFENTHNKYQRIQ